MREHPREPTPDAAGDPSSSKQSGGVTNPEHIERFLQRDGSMSVANQSLESARLREHQDKKQIAYRSKDK